MSAMTRIQMNSEVVDQLLEFDRVKKERPSNLTTRVDRWLNWSQRRIADYHTFEEMRLIYEGSTTDGEKRYGFPTDMKDVYSVRLIDGSNSRKLKYVLPREMDRKIPRFETSSEGRPSLYVDYGDYLELYKVPDDAYDLELRCSIYPDDFSSDSSTSDLDNKDGLIVAGSVVFALRALNFGDEADRYEGNAYRVLMEEALRTDHSAEDWEPEARGFKVGGVIPPGQYWKSPFTGSR